MKRGRRGFKKKGINPEHGTISFNKNFKEKIYM